MITTVAISGYRSLRDVVLPLAELTVITGHNGAGKSNVYRAMRLLAAAASGTMIAAVAREGGFASIAWAGAGPQGPQASKRKTPVAVQFGFAADDLGYLVDLGLPQIDQASRFARDPEIKREQIFAGPVAKPASVLIDRARAGVRMREGSWVQLKQSLAPFDGMLTTLADGDTARELLAMRTTLSSWRFYDSFRVDDEAPARALHVGTRAQTLSNSGENLAAVWATIQDAGKGERLDDAVSDAFPGCRVDVVATDGVFRLVMTQPGILRPLEVSELSDGTLRYLLLCAALLPARPGPLIVLNEPESSLHTSLLPALGSLIRTAALESQVLLITHARALVDAVSAPLTHELAATTAGTEVVGQGLYDRPLWNWGTR